MALKKGGEVTHAGVSLTETDEGKIIAQQLTKAEGISDPTEVTSLEKLPFWVRLTLQAYRDEGMSGLPQNPVFRKKE